MRLLVTFIFLSIYYHAFPQSTPYIFKSAKISTRDIEDHKKYLGVKAPLFILRDTSNAIIRLDSIKGKTLIFHFWYTQCAPCIADMPYFKKVIDYYKDSSSVQIVSICVDKTNNVAGWKQIIKQFELTDCHVFLNRDRSTIKSNLFYKNIDSYPTYLVVNSSYKSLGCLSNIDLLAGFIYEIERAKQGVPTSKSFIELAKADKKFTDWIKVKGYLFMK